MLVVFSILEDVEKRRKDNEDFERFLSTLGFCGKDRKRILSEGPYSTTGQGFVHSSETGDILSIVGVIDEYVELFKKYNILLNIFSFKKEKDTGYPSVDDVVKSLYFSEEGTDLLINMCRLFEIKITTLYYRYFDSTSISFMENFVNSRTNKTIIR